MSDNGALVQVRNLHKVFRRGSERIDVLQGVTLDLPPGDFLALMGPSGSGKTTLLNLLGGLDTPTEGEVVVGGDRIDRMAGGRLAGWRARHVGFVFQFYNLLPVLTAEKNVELPLLLTPLSRGERRRHVATALEVVGLSDRASTTRGSSPAARSSGSASRAPSSPIRRCCCATSRPAISTGSPATRFSTCCKR
jgi:putative ABC transport system ATP-binding protein